MISLFIFYRHHFNDCMAEYKSLLIVGISFLVTALIQLTIYYYQNTLEAVSFLYFFGVAICMAAAVFILAFLVEKGLDRSKKIRYSFIIFIIFFALTALFVVETQTPKGHIIYSYTCPSSLDQPFVFTIQNYGQIFSVVNYPNITVVQKNLTVIELNNPLPHVNLMNLMPIRISPQSIQLNFQINYKQYNGYEINVSVQPIQCLDLASCDINIFTGSKQFCHYIQNISGNNYYILNDSY